MGKLRIISYSGQLFEDRREAGKLLAGELKEFSVIDVVVVGVPRGGVVVAQQIALELDAKLDIILVRKLRTPGEPELAMGSVTEDGKIFLNSEVVTLMDINQQQINQEKSVQLAEISRSTCIIRRIRPKVMLQDRIVILTDDGVATGATTEAAIWAVRQEAPAKLVVAIPVGAEDTIKRLADEADEMICYRVPRYFAAVGQFYARFEPVDDSDIIEILKLEKNRHL